MSRHCLRDVKEKGVPCRRNNTNLEIGESVVCLVTLEIQNNGACGIMGEMSSIKSGPLYPSSFKKRGFWEWMSLPLANPCRPWVPHSWTLAPPGSSTALTELSALWVLLARNPFFHNSLEVSSCEAPQQDTDLYFPLEFPVTFSPLLLKFSFFFGGDYLYPAQ